MSKINTVFIPVADLKESVDWYGDVLGLTIDPEQYHSINTLPVYTFAMGETSLTLEKEDGFTPSPSTVPICNIHTEDIEKVYDDFSKEGVQIQSNIITFPEFSYFNFRDLNGNLLMMCTG
ncbi:VOC family protein [Rossellomorea aquimaris]|uniref:VOC family protein n=1 Tax=Rossellomorea aquimaris TaxID=189382 RepID=UPI001CD33067|nr:VOC family protein [Rossellomorea aquimaris]MCA1054463.1 VOC family protein [Rossellomorea aquimaris]